MGSVQLRLARWARYLRPRIRGPICEILQGRCQIHTRRKRGGSPVYPRERNFLLRVGRGEIGLFLTYVQSQGAAVKRQLIRACIAGIEAIWEVDSRARILTAEPVIHVVPPRGQSDENGVASAYRDSQFEAWDMLSGVLAPELGGQPRYLDVAGVNFLSRQPVGVSGRRKDCVARSSSQSALDGFPRAPSRGL